VFWLWRSELQLDLAMEIVGQRRFWGVIDRGFGFGANLLHGIFGFFYLRSVKGVRGNSGILKNISW
jgi:hypothetical protein